MIQPQQQIGGEPGKVQLWRFRWQICAFSALTPRCSSLSIIYLDYVCSGAFKRIIRYLAASLFLEFFGRSPPHSTADECDRRAPNVLTPTSGYTKGKVEEAQVAGWPKKHVSLRSHLRKTELSSIVIKLEYISDERFFQALSPSHHIAVFRIPYSFGDSHSFHNLRNTQLVARAGGTMSVWLHSPPSGDPRILRLDLQ